MNTYQCAVCGFSYHESTVAQGESAMVSKSAVRQNDSKSNEKHWSHHDPRTWVCMSCTDELETASQAA